MGAHGFSVAQHSLLVLALLQDAVKQPSQELRRAALLHDASEFVTADLITPFKTVIGDAYKSLENRIQAAVHMRFGLPSSLAEEWQVAIKRADRAAAFIEAVELAGFDEDEARRIFKFGRRRPKIALTAWSAEEARERFVQQFRLLAPT